MSGVFRSRQGVSAETLLRREAHTHSHFSFFCSHIILVFEAMNLQILFPFQSLPWGKVQRVPQVQMSADGVHVMSLSPLPPVWAQLVPQPLLTSQGPQSPGAHHRISECRSSPLPPILTLLSFPLLGLNDTGQADQFKMTVMG